MNNNIKEIFYNETVRIKCLDKSEMNLPSKNPYKTPLGFTNIQMTCYMNSALQSLVNVQKLSNYFTQNEHLINSNTQLLSSAFVGVVKNLLRLTDYSLPHKYHKLKKK